MICDPCATAAGAIRHALDGGDLDQPTGHDPAVCVEPDCTCQHKPIRPKETR